MLSCSIGPSSIRVRQGVVDCFGENSRADPDHLRAASGCLTERRPVGHQAAAPFEHVRSAIGQLDRITDAVRERHFGKLARIVRPLSTPIAKTAAEPVRSRGLLHANQQHLHRSGREVLAAPVPGKDVFSVAR